MTSLKQKYNILAGLVCVLTFVILSWVQGVGTYAFAAQPQRIAGAPDDLGSADSTMAVSDTIAADSLANKKKKEGGGLTAVVNYTAKDSLVFSMGNMARLYGESQITYDDIELRADRIRLSLDSAMVYANGVPDTTSASQNKLKGAPVFKDKSGEYETKSMSYNFKTAKGYIKDVVTQQGDGYVTGGTTKKMADNDIFLENGKYTTCDYHECPHFYIQLTKARVRPKKNIVTGPAYLVVADVPLPLAIPFGFFPFTKSYSSGVIMPTYGADHTRGLYLRDGGYYFALNDFMDLTLKGEYYTKGSWGASVASKYAWRYKFSGNYQFSYIKTVTGEKGLPDYSVRTDFKARWSHSQDSRFNPNMTLSASVDFSTSGYDRNNLTSYYSSDMTQSTKSSSVNMTMKVPNKPLSFNVSANVSQRTQDSTLNVTLPRFSMSLSRIYPFKRKVKVGSDRWYEKIAMTYNMQMSNSVVCKQDEFIHKSLIRDWKNSIQHDARMETSFTLLRYVNITPSFSITDRMTSHKTHQYVDPSVINPDGSYGGVARDTIYGFFNVFDYNTSLSMNTKLYGMYKPLPIFKNAKLIAVRHLMTPTVSFSYKPDFGEKKYGYWTTYQLPDSTRSDGFKPVYYSPYEGVVSVPGRGMNGAINFSLSNNIEAKFRSDKDSTGVRKVSIIDNLSTSISYNMAADSCRWSSSIPLSLTIKPGKGTTLNLSASFDTYMFNEKGQIIDVPRWKVHKMPRLNNTGYSFSYQLNNAKLAKLFGFGKDSDDKNSDSDTDIDSDDPTMVNDNLDPSLEKEKNRKQPKKKNSSSTYDDDGYLAWSIPWSINLSYSMRYAHGKFNPEKREYDLKLTHNASMSGSIQPTRNWNFNYSLSFDVEHHKVSYMTINASRDMHCWMLTASLNPLGRYASFNVCIAVKSSMLSDLKYEKSSVSRSNKIDWYDD